MNCNGVFGDMVYLTDLDYGADFGHSITEVQIFRSDLMERLGKQGLNGSLKPNELTLLYNYRFSNLAEHLSNDVQLTIRAP